MARQLRIQYQGAIHHTHSRGNNKQNIFLDDADRRMFLELLAECVERYRWVLYAWVIMSNHYHLVLQTPVELTLSDGMKWLNQMYAEYFNWRWGRSGTIFERRFRSHLIEEETYLRRAVRYVILNPVRAKIVDSPEQYVWSSYRATAGLVSAPSWLAVDKLAPHFGTADSWQANYVSYIAEAIGSDERLWDNAVNQIFLGETESWLKKMRKLVEKKVRSDVTPQIQRAVGRPKMATIVSAVAKTIGMAADTIRHGHGGLARKVVAWIGWWEGLAALRSIAAALRIRSSGRASTLVRECEEELHENPDLQQLVDRTLLALAT